MSGRLTTHALDTVAGKGAAGLRVELRRGGYTLADLTLDPGGRGTLSEALETGPYELVFHLADYHRAKGVSLADPPFLDEVVVQFGVADPAAHYHVPLVFSPHAYSTYRGG
jgi:5-hydroxyisourate hydrolase